MDTVARPNDMASVSGIGLLDDPVLNKGTAFTAAERRTHGLEGLLPATVETIERQLERVMGHLDQKPSDLERYVYLMGLCDRNETLFYKTLMSDPARFVPIVWVLATFGDGGPNTWVGVPKALRSSWYHHQKLPRPRPIA